jgi:hypothetical protein
MYEEEVYFDITYDRKANVKPSDQLLAQAANSGMPIVATVVTHEKDTDRCVQFLSLYPFKPAVGDVITLEDGVVCTVTGVRMQVAVKEDTQQRKYRVMQIYVTAQFNDG